jgi:hypothetical protein
LKEGDLPNTKGFYSIISLNQGKFNLDNEDKEESEEEGKDQQYKRLKDRVRGKHGAVVNETP